jgi:hypothetical protein
MSICDPNETLTGMVRVDPEYEGGRPSSARRALPGKFRTRLLKMYEQSEMYQSDTIAWE